MKCADGVIAAQVGAAALRSKCKPTTKRYHARSTCGRNPALHAAPCIQTSLLNRKIKCTIKSATKKDGVTATNACSVIYFSGGQETCPDATTSSSYLVHYTAQGYVAVCARAFETSTGSAQFPRHREAPRFDTLVRTITADPDVLAGWSGEYLLFSGVSHGASGPVVTMATQAFDDQPGWKGSAYTGGCFFDGTYDVAGLLDFGFTNQCKQASSVVPYERTYSRYCAWPATANGNLPATWPQPSSCATPDTAADTLTTVSVGDLAIRDWKLVECGSALSPCAQDVLPAASIQALCDRIAAAPGYTCDYASFRTSSHIACGIDASTIGSCSSWFEAELAGHGLH